MGFDVDFKLASIEMRFDDPKVRDYYRDILSINPENLFIISYVVKTRQQNLEANFVLDRKATTQSIDENGDETLTYISTKKSVELTAHDGMIVDKYVFVKNGERMFTCSRLDLF